RGTARQQRKGRQLLFGEVTFPAVGFEQQPRLGHVEGAVGLETPGIETDRNVVGIEVVAGEVEVDQAGQLLLAEEDIVGEEIGVDDATGQVPRPLFLQNRQFSGQFGGQVSLYLVRAILAGFIKLAPTVDREVVGPPHFEVAAGNMEAGQVFSDFLTVKRVNATRPEPFKKSDDRGWPAGELPQDPSVARVYRGGAGDGTAGEMLHQPKEEGEISFFHPLFIEREDVAAFGGFQEEIRVFYPFGDTLEGKGLAQVIAGEEGSEFFVGNFRIDGHRVLSVQSGGG